jgi:acyl transferase domain-containing protein
MELLYLYLSSHSLLVLFCWEHFSSQEKRRPYFGMMRSSLIPLEVCTDSGESGLYFVGLGYDQVKDMLPPDIDVACHNSQQSSTISGPVDSVKKFVAHLKGKGVFARVVNVANIAYHSRYIQPAAPLLLKYLKKVRFHSTISGHVKRVTGKPNERVVTFV